MCEFFVFIQIYDQREYFAIAKSIYSLWYSRDTPSGRMLVVYVANTYKHFANFGGSLWAETFRDLDIGESGDVLFSLLDDHKRESRQVGANDAASHRLSLSLSGATGPVAGRARREEESDAAWDQDTLFHWESLLVVSAGNLDDVALELVPEGVSGDLGGHSLVVEAASVWPWGLSHEYPNHAIHGSAYYTFFSSSISKDFWAPVAGLEIFNLGL